MDRVELCPERMVAGGAALAHDGTRVVFVEGGLPGERVIATVTEERRDYARATVAEVVDASPARVRPPCPYVAAGCGGCDWQHVDPARQPGLKRQVVEDALRRLARIPDPPVRLGPPLPATGYRTTLRVAVGGGALGLRHRRSHVVVPVASCAVAHPLVDDLLRTLDPGAARQLVLRAGARTGERMVVASPSARRVRAPSDVRVVRLDTAQRGGRAWFHEEVAGHRFRISAASFFQARPDGAEVLVGLVRGAVGAPAEEGALLVDAYGGVGLFAATQEPGWRAVVLEQHRPAVADARANLTGRRARVLAVDVARWRPEPASAVVADPARSGLGTAAAAALAGTGAPVLVLVSCDPAALGRDAGLLRAHGYALEESVLVDMFPQTSHVEVVSVFRRG